MRKLENRIAIVTGASQGIGKEIAFAFGQQGAKVVVTARTTDAIEAVANQLREIGTEALISDSDTENPALAGFLFYSSNSCINF